MCQRAGVGHGLPLTKKDCRLNFDNFETRTTDEILRLGLARRERVQAPILQALDNGGRLECWIKRLLVDIRVSG